MGDASTIEWTDATWNPSIGCDRVSPGCAHCYALAQAPSLRRRRAGAWEHQEDGGPTSGPAFAFRELPERLEIPLRWRKPRRVFVNSMSDLFHEQATAKHIAAVFAVMSIAEQHTFQVLTKRPDLMRWLLTRPQFWLRVNAERMRRGVSVLPGGMSDTWPTGERVLSNVWLGTSIENRRFVHRADELRATPGAVRFISAEPLLGPLRYETWSVEGNQVTYGWRDGYGGAQLELNAIDWLIVGGESGPRARRIDPEWVHDLRVGADNAGTAFFFKQWGGARPGGEALLDGQEYRAFPRAPHGTEQEER